MSTTTPAVATESPSPLDCSATQPSRWLGWAVFLGMSWTWCIGMFLPVLLVRDYGTPGWIVFAIPNVLGAAAMGWVIRSRESSEKIQAAHQRACEVFSAVTIAFQLFFALAVIGPLAGSVVESKTKMDLAIGGMIGGSLILYLYITRLRGADRTLAWIIFLISISAMLLAVPEMLNPPEGLGGSMRPVIGSSASDLFWLTPICFFGFLCCPYLDLTFHRARRESAMPRASFGVGFGGFFLLMILFTLIYSHAFIHYAITTWVAIFLYVHMACQSGFTVAAHARELQHGSLLAIGVATVLTLVSWGAYFLLPRHPLGSDLMPGELIYRSFMGFYGLVFPAYVWLVMLPFRGTRRPDRKTLAIFATATLIALPMFAAAFLWQQMFWGLIGLAIVLLARVAIDPSNQQNSAPI